MSRDLREQGRGGFSSTRFHARVDNSVNKSNEGPCRHCRDKKNKPMTTLTLEGTAHFGGAYHPAINADMRTTAGALDKRLQRNITNVYHARL